MSLIHRKTYGEEPIFDTHVPLEVDIAELPFYVEMFHNLCNRVIKFSANPIAGAYAAEGLELISERDIKAQIPYILSNLRFWRGKSATETKQALRAML